jgi:hypothetical protein
MRLAYQMLLFIMHKYTPFCYPLLFNKTKNKPTILQCRSSSINPIEHCRKREKSIPLTHIYMTAKFLGLVQVLQLK